MSRNCCWRIDCSNYKNIPHRKKFKLISLVLIQSQKFTTNKPRRSFSHKKIYQQFSFNPKNVFKILHYNFAKFYQSTLLRTSEWIRIVRSTRSQQFSSILAKKKKKKMKKRATIWHWSIANRKHGNATDNISPPINAPRILIGNQFQGKDGKLSFSGLVCRRRVVAAAAAAADGQQPKPVSNR